MGSVYRQAPSGAVTVPAPIPVPGEDELDAPVHWTDWAFLLGGALVLGSFIVAGLDGRSFCGCAFLILMLAGASAVVRSARRPGRLVLERVGARVMGLAGGPVPVGGILRSRRYDGAGRRSFVRLELWLCREGEEERFVGSFPIERRADAETFAAELAALGGYERRSHPPPAW